MQLCHARNTDMPTGGYFPVGMAPVNCRRACHPAFLIVGNIMETKPIDPADRNELSQTVSERLSGSCQRLEEMFAGFINF